MLKRIILFRLYKHPLICKNKLKLLKKFNPEVPIFGLFGGKEEDFEKFQKKLGAYLEDLYCIRGKSVYWKWKNCDLQIRLWYRNVGKSISFNRLHVVDFDLLLCDSLKNIYRHVPRNGVGFTGLTLLKNIERMWQWTSIEPHKTEWDNLLRFARKKYAYKQKPYASLGPGACLLKEFLEEYSKNEVPELCNEEVRLPLFSQIFGFKLYDTGFQKKWFDKNEMKFFNCVNQEIKLVAIKKELSKASGRRVFHPYLKLFKEFL